MNSGAEQLDRSVRNDGGGGGAEGQGRCCCGNERSGRRTRNAEKIEGNKEGWREAEKERDGGRQGDSTIYGRLVVMVISRRERKGCSCQGDGAALGY